MLSMLSRPDRIKQGPRKNLHNASDMRNVKAQLGLT